jgi:cyanophycinase-like exopeptidase
VAIRRIPGDGWLVLIGGGEFSFGETEDADDAWLAKAGDGPVGFVPAASGSEDYGHNFAEYVHEELGREAQIVPVYRARDARRSKNAERIEECAVVYLGGGVPDHLLEALEEGSPVRDALTAKLERGGVVVAIAAAAQAAGQGTRGIRREVLPGLGWLPGGVVDPNFDPEHDRRLRKLLTTPGITWGVGIPPESALLLGPDGAVEIVGEIWLLETPDGDFEVLEG